MATPAPRRKTRSGIVSRGSFLKVVAAATLWPCLDGVRLLAKTGDLLRSETALPAPRFDLRDASAALFRGHLNTTFLIRSETGTRVVVRLASVIERRHSARIEQFSLSFHAPDGAADLQGTCAFEHRTLGHFEAFIVAIGAAAARPIVYEACFSRTLSHG